MFSDMLHLAARNEKAGIVSSHMEEEGGNQDKTGI